MDGAQLKARVTADYPSAGFIVRSVRCLAPEELARWPSTWARRLAHGRARSVFRIDVRAAG